MFPRCPDCGGRVQLAAGPGRTREFLRGLHLPVPDDFEIPACIACGQEAMIPEISEKLDSILGEMMPQGPSAHDKRPVECSELVGFPALLRHATADPRLGWELGKLRYRWIREGQARWLDGHLPHEHQFSYGFMAGLTLFVVMAVMLGLAWWYR